MLTSPEAQKVGKELSDSAQAVTEWMDIITPFLDADLFEGHSLNGPQRH